MDRTKFKEKCKEYERDIRCFEGSLKMNAINSLKHNNGHFLSSYVMKTSESQHMQNACASFNILTTSNNPFRCNKALEDYGQSLLLQMQDDDGKGCTNTQVVALSLALQGFTLVSASSKGDIYELLEIFYQEIDSGYDLSQGIDNGGGIFDNMFSAVGDVARMFVATKILTGLNYY